MTDLGAARMRSVLDRLQRRGLILGVAALLVALGGAAIDGDRFLRAYLVGWLLWLGVALGSLALLMLYHLVGGMWGHLLRRLLEAATRTLPLLLLLFLPIAGGMGRIYPWTGGGEGAPAHNALYLNAPFFLARAAACFAVWIVLSSLLCRWSRRQDETGDGRWALRLQQLSGPGLVLWAVTMTFAGWDWIMSLEPEWWSTIYGMSLLVGQGLSALALMIVLARTLGGDEPLARVARAPVFHDLGNLMLALVMVTAYLAFSQYLIVWSGNLTDEIRWYMPRARTSWGWLAIALVLFYFFVPFVLLLSRRTKRRAAALAGVAAGILVMRLVELIWLVEPSFAPGGLAVHWLDVMVPVGLGGVWLAWFVSRLRREPLLPLHDTRVERAVTHA